MRLGYIGSKEKGWAELGKKTFLRHEYVLLPCRKYRHLKGGV
jgi:hypothetical protein